MKKIIATLAFLMAISFGSQAQDKKASNQDLAKNDAVEIVQFLKLDNKQTDDFFRLFEMKQEVLNNPDASLERKTIMVKVITEKLQASMDSKKFALLESNKELFGKLTGQTVLSKTPKK